MADLSRRKRLDPLADRIQEVPVVPLVSPETNLVGSDLFSQQGLWLCLQAPAVHVDKYPAV